VLCVLAVAALAGCSMTPRDSAAGYAALGDDATAEGRSPMAELPAGAGKIVAVLQSSSSGVLTQRVVLSGDPDTLGENAIVVKVNQSRGPQDIEGPVGPPTRGKIAAELDENFAGVEMRLSESFSRNAFGPFGYAIGHPRTGVTCVYAWQWGLFKPPLIGQASTGAPSLPTDPTSVRVRLCRSTIGEAEIVALLRGMQVFPPNSRIAYVDPSTAGAEPGGDALAAAGVGYFVVPGAEKSAPVRERLEPAQKHRKIAHSRHRHRERDVAEEDRAVATEPPAHGVAVPMPAGGAAAVEARNPLLAPLATTGAARAATRDDMPLPGASASLRRPAAGSDGVSVPLPN
jgi:hypothetical protein